jgi:pimeloyl-ACP methyl ester carboxylesterase
MRKRVLLGLATLGFTTHALSGVQPFPPSFKNETISTNGTKVFVRVGGHGPAVLLLHGYGETGDMWAPLAAKLSSSFTVVVPDLRGMGLSAHPSGGYDKKTQGGDLAGVLEALKIDKVALVTHDIGNMVGYAFAAEQPSRVTKFVLLDAPLPGIGPWEEILKSPLLWHFRSEGPTWNILVKGASASTSIGSGTSSRRIRRTSTRPSPTL